MGTKNNAVNFNLFDAYDLSDGYGSGMVDEDMSSPNTGENRFLCSVEDFLEQFAINKEVEKHPTDWLRTHRGPGEERERMFRGIFASIKLPFSVAFKSVSGELVQRKKRAVEKMLTILKNVVA